MDSMILPSNIAYSINNNFCVVTLIFWLEKDKNIIHTLTVCAVHSSRSIESKVNNTVRAID